LFLAITAILVNWKQSIELTEKETKRKGKKEKQFTETARMAQILSATAAQMLNSQVLQVISA
jgi:hypothetical protein